MKRLNFGCGNDIRYGYINLDNFNGPGVDVIHDVENFPYPFKDDDFDEIILINVLEHLSNPVKVLEELHRIVKPGGQVVIRVPYYNARDMYTDPTHKSFFSQYSFDYFDPSKKHCQERPYYSSARFKILDIGIYTKLFTMFFYRKISNQIIKSFCLWLAGIFGNVVWVIEFDLEAIR
mgnify:CR=1 FL=1